MKYAILDNNDKVICFTTDASKGGIPVDGLNTSNLKTKLDIEKAVKIKEIKQIAQNKIDELSAKYAPYEVASFADQRAEWKLYIADNNAKTPIVDAIANARGISRDDLFTKIGNNVTAIATAQGQQNALEDAIEACATIEDLEAIEI